MRHGKKFNHLSRKAPHRKAMLANMASSLLKHKRIKTTVAKAKALRSFVEPLLTKAKDDTTHSRRMVFRYLRDKYAVTELFRDVAPKIADRPGGYTRILKTGNRLGDNAEMCLIELVDFNEALMAEPKTGAAAEKKPRTRRGRRKKDGTDAKPAVSAKVEAKPIVEDAEIVEEEVEVKEEAKTEEETDTKNEDSSDTADNDSPEKEEEPEAKTENTPVSEVEEVAEEQNTDAETKEDTKEDAPEDTATEEGEGEEEEKKD